MDCFNTISNIIMAGSALYLAYAAKNGLKEYKRQKKFDTKFQLAREAIKIFDQLQKDISCIRDPRVYEKEKNDLKQLPEDNELIRKAKKQEVGGIVLLRLNDRVKSFEEMNTLEPMFELFIGKVDAFKKIREIFRKINNTAEKIVHSGTITKEDEDIIWQIPDQENKDGIKNDIGKAVEEIQKACKKVLEV